MAGTLSPNLCFKTITIAISDKIINNKECAYQDDFYFFFGIGFELQVGR